jgi:hypothetical protein
MATEEKASLNTSPNSLRNDEFDHSKDDKPDSSASLNSNTTEDDDDYLDENDDEADDDEDEEYGDGDGDGEEATTKKAQRKPTQPAQPKKVNRLKAKRIDQNLQQLVDDGNNQYLTGRRQRKAPQRLEIDFRADSYFGRNDTEELELKRKEAIKKRKINFLHTSKNSDQQPPKNNHSLHNSIIDNYITNIHKKHKASAHLKKRQTENHFRYLSHDRSFSRDQALSPHLLDRIEEFESIPLETSIALNEKVIRDSELHPLQVSLHGPLNEGKPVTSSSSSATSSGNNKKTIETYYLLPENFAFGFDYDNEVFPPSLQHQDDSMPLLIDSHFVGGSLPIKVIFQSVFFPTPNRQVGYIFDYIRDEEGCYRVFFMTPNHNKDQRDNDDNDEEEEEEKEKEENAEEDEIFLEAKLPFECRIVPIEDEEEEELIIQEIRSSIAENLQRMSSDLETERETEG